MEGHSPLAQFEIQRWIPLQAGGLDWSFTNSSFMMLLIVLSVWVFMVGGMSRATVVPGRWQSMVELTYEFIANMLTDAAGRDARKYFPFIFTLFTFVLAANLIGLIPMGFTVTSHIIVTFALAAIIFLGVTVIGFARHGLGYFKLFAPQGIPFVMLVILVPIELMSYCIRPLTLSVRLFANMMVGHTLLKVIGGFVVMLGIFGILPMAILVAFMALEFLVAFLQAYIFAVLACIYLNEAINMHH